MQTVEAVMRRVAEANPERDPAQLVRLVKAELDAADWDSFILDKLKDYQREVNHRREMSAFKMFSPPSGEEPRIDISRLRSVFNTPIRLGDGFMTTWGAATVEQHQMRIAMLQKQIDGLTDTQRRHEEAIKLIESAGVKCLNDLDMQRQEAA